MGGGKNVHRNLYNEEFHYTRLDIHDTVYLRVRVVHVCVYTHAYTHTPRNIERRVSSTEIRSVYICCQPPSRCPLPFPHLSAFSDLCMNHDAPASSPCDRFFVSPTFVGSSSRREQNLPLTLRLAIGNPRVREARERSRERAETSVRAS